MGTAEALTLAGVLTVLAAIALAKPAKTLVSGFLQRDKKGRFVLVLTPAKRKRKKR